MSFQLSSAAVKAVEFSNSHMTKADSELLVRFADEHVISKEPPVVMSHAYGFMINVGELTVAKIKEAGASKDLSYILDSCLDTGDVMYLAFDAVGDLHEGLPTHSW